MPRKKETRATTIYWLVDTRPDTIAAGWPNGLPFYCGKTVFDHEFRLRDHRRDAIRHPHRLIAKRMVECGDFVRSRVMEMVPLDQNWGERERYWISTLRLLYPGCVNVAVGGQGASGVIRSAETRRRMSESNRNSEKRKAATLARTGKPSGQKHTEETKQKLREAHLGMKASDATREKMRESAKLKAPLTAEHIRKAAESHRGKKRSLETRQRISEAQKKSHARRRDAAAAVLTAAC